jgi:hypothetical protein
MKDYPFQRGNRRSSWKEPFPISPYGLYGYVRHSSDPQLKGDGPRRQRQTILDYCEENDFDIVGVDFIRRRRKRLVWPAFRRAIRSILQSSPFESNRPRFSLIHGKH